MDRREDQNSSAAVLDRFIGRLNSNWDLNLDLNLQQSRQRQGSLPRSHTLENEIIDKINRLHRQSPGRLAEASAKFLLYAQKGTLPKDRPARLDCLHRVLSKIDRKRRQHSHGQHSQHSQRSQARALDFSISKPGVSKPRHDACPKSIDALPVSSRAPSAAKLKQNAAGLGASKIAGQTRSEARTRPPHPTHASEPKVKEKAADPIPNPTFNLNPNSKRAESKRAESEDYFSSGWEPSVEEFDTAVLDASVQIESRSSMIFGQSVDKDSAIFSSRVGKQPILADSHRSPRNTRAAATSSAIPYNDSQAPTTKIENVWPKPLPGLLEAPLPVIWEVTRAALHCRVDMEDLATLKYEPNAKWHEQKNFRAMLAAHSAFEGKQLPAPSEASAWTASLNSFQLSDKAVQLYVELSRCSGVSQFNVRCQPLKLELGHRLSRRFGADRFLEVILPSPSSMKDFDTAQLVDWLNQGPHRFVGRTWVPFFNREVKPKKKKGAANQKGAADPKIRILFFACNGLTFRPSNLTRCFPPHEEALTPLARTPMSLTGLLQWAVNIRENAHQPIMKLFSRLSLSLSRTVPTVVLELSQILIREKDLGARQVMNDGIGRMSRKLAHIISARLGLTDCASAFQARLGSAKGVWIIDVNHENPEEEWIEVYPSQLKWKCDFMDPRHRTFEVRDWSKELKPASLSQQLIPVLEAQSDQPETLRASIRKHVEKELLTDLEAQIQAMKDPQDFRLWLQSSNISDRSFDGSPKFLGGLPDSNVDRVAFLLDSGFHPKELKFMNELVYQQFIKRTELLSNKMNVMIPCSTYALMTVDFSGTLEEGEVHLSFSTKFQVEGFSDTLLEGMDILVARSPAHYPSDIQKVRVVSRPELRQLKDVIVFPTKGQTPLADKLSGGDYDGDIAWICWDQEIVKDFRNAPDPIAADLFKEGYLEKDTRKFSDLLRIATTFDCACQQFISEALLFNLQPKFLGRCTKYKEKLCYEENSVTSEAAIHLSTLLSNLVDQSKQGILFNENDWKRFCKEFIVKRLVLDEPAYITEKKPQPTRGGTWKLHILDHLLFDVVKPLIEKACIRFSQAINEGKAQHFDSDLIAVRQWYENQDEAVKLDKMAKSDQSGKPEDSGFTDIHKDLKDRIALVAEFYSKSLSSMKSEDTDGFAAVVKQAYQKWFDIKIPPELMSKPFALKITQHWGTEPAFHPWQIFKASVTFTVCQKTPKFCWGMAGRQLGYIKAMRRRDQDSAPVLVIPQIWGVLKPDKKMIMRLSASREAAQALVESASSLEEVFEIDDDNGTVIDDVF